MPYPVNIPIQFVRLRFESGGSFLVPLSDQQALQIHESLYPMAQGYISSLQQQLNKEGKLEDLLSEVIPGPLFRKELEIDFPPASDKVSYPAFTISLEVIHNEGPHQFWGLIPALGLENVGKTEEQLLLRLADSVKAHLNRMRKIPVLERIISSIWLHQPEYLEVPASLDAIHPWEWGAQGNLQQNSWLLNVATLVLPGQDQQCFGREKGLLQLKRAISNPYLKSTVVIAPSGAGKTALIYELARANSTKPPLLFETTAARLIKELTTDSGWQDNIAFLLSEMQRSGAFLYVRQLRELFEIGQYEGNNVSIAEYLIPALSRGELQLITECSPSDQSWIKRKSPGFFSHFHSVKLPPLGADLGKVVRKKIQLLNPDLKVYQSGVDEALDLHKRFFPYSGEPGQTIRFLENLVLKSGQEGTVIDRKTVIRYFAEQSNIPALMIDPEIPFERDTILSDLNQQVFGQSLAVEGITDVLGAIKNQLVRPDKPIASFLFIGPTGVGKTELAKVLAEFMFGDRNKMERFDMSEFSSPAAVFRLTGQGGGLLTSTIRRTPFCVLLFDELEKAHPDFYDLLLQILGEGRLTDQFGKVVNFCSTIIIMTSNIGAEAAQTSPIRLGKEEDKVHLREHFQRAVQKKLRPELVNRIDRIVPFDPLSAEIMTKVVEREIAQLKQREGIRHRRLDLDIQPDVLHYLATEGYDEKLGARQLQRCMREQLIIPIAKALNASEPDEHLQLNVELKEGKPHINLVVDPLNVELWLEEYEKVSLVTYISQNRRDLQQSRQSNIYIQLLSELDILKRQKKKNDEEFWKNSEKARNFSRYSEGIQSLDLLQKRIEDLEEEISLSTFNLQPYHPDINDRLEAWKADFLAARSQLYRLLYSGLDRITVAVYGKSPYPMVQFYQRLFENLGLEYQAEIVILQSQNAELTFLPEPADWEEDAHPATYAWIANVNGPGAGFLLDKEEGLTEFIDQEEEATRFMVVLNPDRDRIPRDILRKEYYQSQSPRRTIYPGSFTDSQLNIRREFGKEGPTPFIAEELQHYYSDKMDRMWGI